MGKVSRAFFQNGIARHLGEKLRAVVVGPANGVDVGVVRLPDGRALVSTTDPIYIVPQYGWERAAWFAFHILASDLTTSGVAPQYVTMDWNLPMDIEDDQIETMLRIIDRECRKYGAAIVTGHTGRYEGCAYPMVGGATFLAIAPKDGWVTSNMARPGNHLLVTKTAALEATAILSNTFPDLIERKLGADVTKRARALFDSMSTVDDALAAASVGVRRGGVWAMHDATEGGVRNAVWEMAQASGLGVDVNLASVHVDPAVSAVQLRDKGVYSPEERTEAGRRLRDLSRGFGVPFLVNDDPQLARQMDADGVHVGRDDPSPRIARAVLGPQAIIGVTVYGKPGEESAAAEGGADYTSVGPFFPSSTKPEEPVLPMRVLDAVVHRSPLPVFAIGGVTAKNAALLARHRVAGVAVVSAIMEAPDPRRAAEAIRRAFFGASGP